MKNYRLLISVIVNFFPWPLKRYFLNGLLGYELHREARIGFSLICPRRLSMGAGAKIGSWNVAVHLDEMEMGEMSSVGRGNWITGYPSGVSGPHFGHDSIRRSRLTIGRHSAITKNHHIDCTNEVVIGDFVTIAGYYSQILTHSIDIYENRQDSAPVIIGDYTFIGTNVVILGGSIIGPKSVLGAKSLLNGKFSTEFRLLAGIPAREVKELDRDAKYFHRSNNFVY